MPPENVVSTQAGITPVTSQTTPSVSGSARVDAGGSSLNAQVSRVDAGGSSLNARVSRVEASGSSLGINTTAGISATLASSYDNNVLVPGSLANNVQVPLASGTDPLGLAGLPRSGSFLPGFLQPRPITATLPPRMNLPPLGLLNPAPGKENLDPFLTGSNFIFYRLFFIGFRLMICLQSDLY